MKKPFFHDAVQQVYDMYQSQPRDEEGWLEMSKAIKAAEEYEASLKEQQERVNGLTEAEWNDLLRIGVYENLYVFVNKKYFTQKCFSIFIS